MSVDNSYVGDAGVESGKMVLYSPRGAGVRSRILGPDLGNGCFGAYLRTREQFCRKIKRSWCENKLVRKESL
jgi:hypothetical protein